MSYLVFIGKPTGYELREREGDPPAVGERLEEDAGPVVVTQIGSSPFPGDRRRCAYTQAA